jgi:predicted transposase YbfD/YdcC
MEPGQKLQGILATLGELHDPRSRKCLYPLEELLLVALCAITSGADGWVSVAEWGNLKLEWLRRFLPFTNGIASHDTFGDFFARLNAKTFEACFMRWIRELCPGFEGQHLAIDGKSLRRSHDGAQRMVHLVSAWASAANVCLGQVKTAEKSNEITAIPELLQALAIKGAVITIDAMGTQHDIVEVIRSREADYVLAVKENQPGLYDGLKDWFAATEAGTLDRPFWENTQLDKGHGRLETRRCVVSHDVAWLKEQGQEWRDLSSIVMLESTRAFINGKRRGECSIERRYYISSLPAKPARLAQLIRDHWSIENSMHWVLDMAFAEDDSRIRVGNGAENFATLRRMALNRLKQDAATKLGVANKRLKAAWDVNYLAYLLGL